MYGIIIILKSAKAIVTVLRKNKALKTQIHMNNEHCISIEKLNEINK